MENFIESFDDFKGNKQIEEASEIAEFNNKLKLMGEDAKEAREKATIAKDKYEELIKKGDDAAAKIEMLNYTKYKSKAAMLNAEIELMSIESADKKPSKKEDK